MNTTGHKRLDVFVAADGNQFMADIGAWFVEAATLLGREATLVSDRLPNDPDVANLVVAPHEFFALHEASDAELNAAAAVSVPISTEQPKTPWFGIGVSYCRPAPLVLDINRHGAAALARENLDVRYVQLGATPSMSAAPVERDLDVLFLGGNTEYRRRHLAPLGPVLAERHSELRLFDFATPVHGSTPGLVFGSDKYDLLARARILVNIHRDERSGGYFEWARMVEAMANGCTVVSEPAIGHEPLVAGEHFVATTDLAATVAELLDDPDRCAAIGAAARDAVTTSFPLTTSLAPILDEIDRLDVSAHLRRSARTIRRNPIRRARSKQMFAPFTPAKDIRARVYRALLDEQRLRREIDAVRCTIDHGAPGHITEITSPGYAAGGDRTPEVSVVVTLYNYAHVVDETLESVAASRDVDLELIVIDDHSSDDGRAVVEAFIDRHRDLPTLLLGRDDNHGLAEARNLGVERSRADKVMILDADNLLYPLCLRRLADALDADPSAAFAYATLEAFGVAPGLRSHLAWHPPWLCASNYIDAQAMVRTATFHRHGGYRTDDDFVYGWEDWDFWLRLAAAGEHGVHLPEMLGRYRTQEQSMISITNLAADMMRQHIEQRYPDLPW